MNERRYGSPGDFRRALTDSLRALADGGPWTLPQLQRQIAYDRLLARLYHLDRNWIIKGATALLARDIGVRGTIDVDVYRAVAIDTAERDLREAAGIDLGDWFRFETSVAAAVSDGAAGIRIPVTAYVGAAVWQTFRVDLVGADLSRVSPTRFPRLSTLASQSWSSRATARTRLWITSLTRSPPSSSATATARFRQLGTRIYPGGSACDRFPFC